LNPSCSHSETAATRVALCADYPEEGWPSMDRVATMLLSQLDAGRTSGISLESIRPSFVHRAGRISGTTPPGPACITDRIINRMIDYPRQARRLRSGYDVFHIVDHSYSQLVHDLPAERTVVTCHDLDTYRSVLHPEQEPASPAFRMMTRRILAGFRKAARITCDTEAIRDQITSLGLVPPERLTVAPMGVSGAFTSVPHARADLEARQLVDVPDDALLILHVGSTSPRKRLDLLVAVFGAIAHQVSSAVLVRVGGAFAAEQQHQIEELALGGRIRVIPSAEESTLAALYRRAAVLLLPSDREGFGLPLVEALACGTPVVASDIPVLREVGGDAVEHCAPGDVDSWARRVLALLEERGANPERWRTRQARGIARAAQFTWDRFAGQLVDIYRELAWRSDPSAVSDRRVASTT
jgi:glycosyltransferase involved in cell wall biosynthesis